MKVFDFECACGVTEHFVKSEETVVHCTVCNTTAEKKLSAPIFKLEGWSGSFPGAASKWERRHEKGHADFVKEHGPNWESV